MALLQVAPVPQSAALPQLGGGVHLAPVHVTPVAQSLSPLHVDELHLAPLHSPPTVHVASPVQLFVLHLAPVHRLLDGHAASPAHVAGVLHLALLQR